MKQHKQHTEIQKYK